MVGELIEIIQRVQELATGVGDVSAALTVYSWGGTALSCSPFQAAGTEFLCLLHKRFSASATGQGRRHNQETTVDHALMRGLVTA